MTRENLLQAIYDNLDDWSCQYTCPHTMEEENPQEVCMECANELLVEYENQIKVEAINEFLNNVSENIIWRILVTIARSNIYPSDGVDIIIDYLHKVAEELKEQNNG